MYEQPFFQKSGVNLEKLTKLYVIIIVQNKVKQPKCFSELSKVPKIKFQSMHNSEGDVKTMPAPNYIPLEVKLVCILTP